MNIKQRSEELLNAAMTVFIVGMFGVFPLYYEDTYFNMGEAKYHFVKYFAICIFAMTFVLWLGYLFTHRKQNTKWKLSLTDYFASGYGVIVIISYLLTPYKDTGFWGYDGWYMGMFSQILFLCIYFFIARFYQWERFMLIPILGNSSIVFLLAILHRFRLDPLGMYEGVAESQFILFLTTIGQATWYSSYLCIVLPIGLFLFWYTKNKKMHIIMALYLILGFMTLVTQNSDSAFLAVAATLLVLFSFSFKKNESCKRFLQILMLAFLSFQGIGILQKIFIEKAMILEPLSMFLSQSKFASVSFLLVFFSYILFCLAEKKKQFEIKSLRRMPNIIFAILFIVIILVVILIYFTTLGKLPAGLQFLQNTNYFNFNSNWGNGRGFSWQTSIMIFKEFPFINKIFGCGPDCFAPYSYEFYGELLSSKWGDTVLTNAHNEWLSSVLFFGVAGAAAYIGIFISQIKLAVKKATEEPYLIAVIMCIVAYMVHNFFCYQQIVCTPLIFIIMGVGEAIMRREKNAV